MNYKLKYNKEVAKSGCCVVAEIICSTNQVIKKEEIMIIFSDIKRQKFYYYKSPFNGIVTDLHIEIGQVVILDNHVITIRHELGSPKDEVQDEYNSINSKDNDEDLKFNSSDIGCYSFLIRIVFVGFYFVFEPYEHIDIVLYEDAPIHRIQFWTGLLGTLLITYFISWFIVKVLFNFELYYDEESSFYKFLMNINPKYIVVFIFLINLICWLLLPDLVCKLAPFITEPTWRGY